MLITVQEVNGWLEKTKSLITALDSELAGSVTEQVFATVRQVIDPASWIDASTTPTIIRKIIAMLYAGWYYQRTYSEDEETNSYGLLLIGQAERLLAGIASGALIIDGATPAVSVAAGLGRPNYYPNDLSSSLSPTIDDPSLGGPRFTMGTIW